MLNLKFNDSEVLEKNKAPKASHKGKNQDDPNMEHELSLLPGL